VAQSEVSIKTWASLLFSSEIRIYAACMQTESVRSVLLYPHRCHPALRGQRGSFGDPWENDDGTKL